MYNYTTVKLYCNTTFFYQTSCSFENSYDLVCADVNKRGLEIKYVDSSYIL